MPGSARPSKEDTHAAWASKLPEPKRLQRGQRGQPHSAASYAPVGEVEDEELGAKPKHSPDSPAFASPVPSELPTPSNDLHSSSSSSSAQECCKWECCDADQRGIDEMFVDCLIRPLINRTLSFFSEPINVSLFFYYIVGMLVLRYVENWTYFESAYFLTVTATSVCCAPASCLRAMPASALFCSPAHCLISAL